MICNCATCNAGGQCAAMREAVGTPQTLAFHLQTMSQSERALRARLAEVERARDEAITRADAAIAARIYAVDTRRTTAIEVLRVDFATERAAREKAEAACARLRELAPQLAHVRAAWESLQVGMLVGTGLSPKRQQEMLDHQARERELRDELALIDAGSALLADLARLRAIETAARALSAALESPPWSNAQATGEPSAPTGESGHDDWIRGHKHALWQFAQTVGAAGEVLRAALDAKAGS